VVWRRPEGPLGSPLVNNPIDAGGLSVGDAELAAIDAVLGEGPLGDQPSAQF
jgi:hypothetical protein